MFVGRENELNTLEKLYSKGNFQMVIMYGRRRVGKTTLIKKFIGDKPAIFFVVQEANDKMNLEFFSRTVYSFFDIPSSVGAFKDWNAAFDFIAEKAKDRRFILAIDEFPYAAEENRGIKSILQNVIDHKLKDTGLFIILCGSHMSFMENEVLGYKSTLYGRRTSQMKVEGFDYIDCSKLLNKYSKEDVIKFYCSLGGTPHYLSQVNQSESFAENISELYFDISGYLYDEPMMLLQQELREPAMYNSIITAIAAGASKLNEISTKIGEERSKTIKYLQTLINLRILHKEFPFGEDIASSRKGIYKISDNCYNFWYRYVFPNKPGIEQGAGRIIADTAVLLNLSEFIGKLFEEVCMQYLVRLNRAGKLPFVFTKSGHWWGNNKAKREQTEIDIVAANDKEGKIILGECKWRNQFDDVSELKNLIENAELIASGYKEKHYILFSKVPFSNDAKEMAKEMSNVKLVDLDMLFDV